MTATNDKTDSVKPRVNTGNATTVSQATGKTEIRGKEGRGGEREMVGRLRCLPMMVRVIEDHTMCSLHI